MYIVHNSKEAMAEEGGLPNQTLYISNINEKIKINVLKRMLKMIFSQYGKISQIVARKSLKLRGQAWIVYSNVNSSVAALRGKQGLIFYDKQLVTGIIFIVSYSVMIVKIYIQKIEFAKEKSHTVLMKEGITPLKRLRKRGREEDAEEEDGGAVKKNRD
jgi:RNA recognition motif-containing protein